MMALAATPKRMTLADYASTPETTQPYEIIDGELRSMPTPLPDHQLVSLEVERFLYEAVVPAGLGRVFHAPLDLLIRENPLRTRQPDVFVIAAEELARYPDYRRKLPMRARPLLVVEIGSASNTPAEIANRLVDYASLGIAEAWIVSLENPGVEVLRLEGGEYRRTGIFRGEQHVVSPALPHLGAAAGQFFL